MTPFVKFYSALAEGELPLAVPITHVSGATGLSSTGAPLVPGSKIHNMAYSDDARDRAAIAILGCQQALLSTERAHEGVSNA